MSEPTSLEKEAVVILDDEADNCDVEFGFEVNVLDLIDAKKINHDDEAIVSFGTVLNSPESGIASSEEPNELAVKIPNYAQIVQYVAKSWKKVEQELKKGTAQKYWEHNQTIMVMRVGLHNLKVRLNNFRDELQKIFWLYIFQECFGVILGHILPSCCPIWSQS